MECFICQACRSCACGCVSITKGKLIEVNGMQLIEAHFPLVMAWQTRVNSLCDWPQFRECLITFVTMLYNGSVSLQWINYGSVPIATMEGAAQCHSRSFAYCRIRHVCHVVRYYSDIKTVNFRTSHPPAYAERAVAHLCLFFKGRDRPVDASVPEFRVWCVNVKCFYFS